jgi:hypothetical protein
MSNHAEEITGCLLAVAYQVSLSERIVGFGLHELMIVVNAGLVGFVGAYIAHKAKKLFNSKNNDNGK